MKVTLTEEALDDLQSIYEYISGDSVIRAGHLEEKILSHISKLADFPNLGINPKDGKLIERGYKMLVCGNYLVFYVKIDGVIEVRAIKHGARLYDKI